MEPGLMERALHLARHALGHTSPNPAVGAVIVKDGLIVGEGYTQPAGSDHAEVVALKQAGEAARGALLCVTLEPCCHLGRTPPCVDAIRAAGIREVHMSVLDPNPLVSGKGKAALEAAGIRTYLGEGAEEATQINEAFFKYITTGLPFVTAKFAMSLDGKIATKTGDSRWISSEESRRLAHHLRAISDAIMVGVNTILIDDPQLTPRLEGVEGQTRRWRIVVDSRGRTPLSAKVLSGPGKALIAATFPLEPPKSRQLREAGAEVLELPSREGLVDLGALLKALGQREIVSVLAEGGGTLLGSLFDQKLVDKVLVFIAPIIIGGREAPPAVGGEGVEMLAEALRLKRVQMERLGDDMLIKGYTKG